MIYLAKFRGILLYWHLEYSDMSTSEFYGKNILQIVFNSATNPMFGEQLICMNDFIKKYIIIKYENQINCINCGRKTNKSFARGYCYPCFLQSPQTSDCIFKPHLCKAHLGE